MDPQLYLRGRVFWWFHLRWLFRNKYEMLCWQEVLIIIWLSAAYKQTDLFNSLMLPWIMGLCSCSRSKLKFIHLFTVFNLKYNCFYLQDSWHVSSSLCPQPLKVIIETGSEPTPPITIDSRCAAAASVDWHHDASVGDHKQFFCKETLQVSIPKTEQHIG